MLSSSFVRSVCLSGGKQATNVAQIRLSLSVPRERVCASSRVVKAPDRLPGWCLVNSLPLSRLPSQICQTLCVGAVRVFNMPLSNSTFLSPGSARLSSHPLWSRASAAASWLASCTVVAFSCHLHKSSSPFNIRASRMRTSSTGRSSAPTLTRPILCTIFIPLLTLPKIVCLPSSQGVGASVMKN